MTRDSPSLNACFCKHGTSRTGWLATLSLILPGAAQAHTLITPYALPIPFWLYLYGCVATLVLTFAVLVFTRSPASTAAVRAGDFSAPIVEGRRVPPVLLFALRVAALGCLVLAVVAGLIGTPSPTANIGMALFWYGFMLGFAYLTAVVGNLYRLVNPWRTIIDCTEALGIAMWEGRIAYPAWLAYWPAFLFYGALVWIELLILPRPSVLSWMLLAYSVITFSGAWLFGARAWFHHADVFGVFFSLIGKLAPVAYALAGDGRSWLVRFRPPLTGAVNWGPNHMSLVLFVLFMLSSTTYDAVHDTSFWAQLYWKNLLMLLQPLWGADMARAQALLGPWYQIYQRLSLLLSPFVYLGIYLGVIWLTRRVTRTRVPLHVLSFRFAGSIIPIALAYSVAHYYALLLTTAPVVPFLISDPFGFGWNLFGTAHGSAEPPPLDMGHVWHVAVLVILAGHVASVYLVNRIAVQVFPAHARTWVAELPLLVLMIGYTLIGLLVLALPLALH